MQNFISTETSQTAMACEQAAVFGATPGPDEFDNREIWNEDEALAGIEEAIHILAGAVAPDGTQLADERESLLWGFVNALHAQVQRLDRGIDKIAPEMKDLQREQDGSEIKSRELELLTDRVRKLGDRRDAFEAMRDLAAEGYRTETGDTWRPRHGSHSSQTGKLTSAAIDARDYLRARKDRETTAHPTASRCAGSAVLLTPSEEGGVHGTGSHDRDRSGEEQLSAARCAGGWVGCVPQEAEPGEAVGLCGCAATLHGGDGGVRRRAPLRLNR